MRSLGFALCIYLVLAGPSLGQDRCTTPVVIPGVRGNATTSKFGDGYITRTSDGRTTTTQRFGDGTISRSSSGALATTTRLGSGFTTSQSSGRGGAGVLVVPGAVRCR